MTDARESGRDHGADDAPLGQQLLEAFWWLDRRAEAELRRAGAPDIRPPHILLFGQLDPDGTRPSELARRLGVSRQAVHQTVDELVARGLVTRRGGAGPGVRIVLTDQGARVADAARAATAAAERTYERRIGAGAARGLRAALAADPGDPEAP